MKTQFDEFLCVALTFCPFNKEINKDRNNNSKREATPTKKGDKVTVEKTGKRSKQYL